MPNPPKPTARKKIEGNPGQRPLNDEEPTPRLETPPCPDWLDAVGRAAWFDLLPEMEAVGLITIVDGYSFAAFCQAWSEFRIATAILEKEGRTTEAWTMRRTKNKKTGRESVTWVKVKGSCVSHPAVQQQRSAWEAIRRFSNLFGLDPSSRSRMNIQKKAEVDPLDKFTKPRIAQGTV